MCKYIIYKIIYKIKIHMKYIKGDINENSNTYGK